MATYPTTSQAPVPLASLRPSADPYADWQVASKMSAESLAKSNYNAQSVGQFTTSSAGSGWVQLKSSPAFRVRFTNTTTTPLVFAYGTGNSATNLVKYVPTLTECELFCVANANEWYVQRNDASATTVTQAYLLQYTV